MMMMSSQTGSGPVDGRGRRRRSAAALAAATRLPVSMPISTRTSRRTRRMTTGGARRWWAKPSREDVLDAGNGAQ